MIFLHGERYVSRPLLLKNLSRPCPLQILLKNMLFFSIGYCWYEEGKAADDISLLIPISFPRWRPRQLWRGDNENVIILCRGCQTIGIYPYRKQNQPSRVPWWAWRSSARVYIRKQLGDPNLMTFARFRALRRNGKNVSGSFLERHAGRACCLKTNNILSLWNL